MTAQQQFEEFLRKYDPAVAAEAKKSLAKLRKLIPNAVEMVYYNYNALVIGFGPGMRPSEAILSIAVMPKWVSLCFLQDAGLPDPEQRLEGSGNVARHIKMKNGAVTLDEPGGAYLSGAKAAVYYQIGLSEAAAAAERQENEESEIAAAQFLAGREFDYIVSDFGENE